MLKNTASQKIQLFAFTVATGAAKTGDAANITAYVSKDYGAVTVLGDTSATEMDATNAPGWYMFDLTQAETNADTLLFTAKSATSGVAVVGRPVATSGPAQTGDSYARLGAPAGASVAADVAAVKAVLPAALVSGRIDASVGAMAANVLTATAIATDAITDAKVAADVTIASVTGAVGSVSGAVGSVTGAVGSVTAAVTLTAAYDAAKTAAQAGDAMALTSGERTTLAGVIFASVVEGTTTFVQVVRGFAAALLGKASGMDSSTAVFRDLGDTKNRISATTDASGNRTAVTLDLT
jgi:hypothetical protein